MNVGWMWDYCWVNVGWKLDECGMDHKNESPGEGATWGTTGEFIYETKLI